MDERAAMRRAADLAASAQRTSPNPKVGCVVLAADGTVLGEGFHAGAGGPHAEVEALRRAGATAAGATAVVTLEPCNHTGRTGPCTQALLAAGIARVVVGRRDPNPEAAGGIETLRAAGVDVVVADPDPGVAALNKYWEFAVRHARPAVVWKTATTLDGRVAASDGSSRWITGPPARAEVHQLRAELDAVMVGTGTALADDPELTVRGMDAVGQPLRVVVGRRALPPNARVLDGTAPVLLIAEHDPAAVLQQLWDHGVRSVLLEGGPTLATAFARARLIDFVVWFTAGLLLGSGRSVVDDLGITALSQAQRFELTGARRVGADVRIDLMRKD